MELLEAIKNRRSRYSLSKESTISDQRIEEVIEHSILHTPTPFNIQNGRAVLLLGKNHERIWDLTLERLREVTNDESFNQAKGKVDNFRNSYGTIAIFEDMKPLEDLMEKFPAYKTSFPVWSSHALGMLTGNIWVSLEAEGLGLNLQHYANLIGEDVKKEFNLPESWVMSSQMPFGKPVEEADAKEFEAVESRFKVFK